MIQHFFHSVRSYLTPLFALGLAATMTLHGATADYNLPANKLAIQGYDPVTYFTQSKAVLGTASFKTQHDGVTYYFSSAQTLATFQADTTCGKTRTLLANWATRVTAVTP